jgi:hypothetical protein
LYASVAAANPGRILFIADSHGVGEFGKALDEKLRGIEGSAIWTAASCGSSPSWWFYGTKTPCGYFERTVSGQVTRTTKAPTPLLSRMLNYHRNLYATQLVLIEQGSNQVLDDPAHAEAMTRRMAEFVRAARAECVWIGPPQMRTYAGGPLDRAYQVIERALAGTGCVLLDSRKLTTYPEKGGDGIHFNFPGGDKVADDWAEGVYREISPQL